jgi:hypothetical protein
MCLFHYFLFDLGNCRTDLILFYFYYHVLYACKLMTENIPGSPGFEYMLQFLGMKENSAYFYNYSGHYPSSCLLFKTQLNSIGLSVPHRKHITSPLRAQQVNVIYRFMTMVY